MSVLQNATPEMWLEQAVSEKHRASLLMDHANCERKAAASALALMNRYPRQLVLCQQLSRIAREELRHYEQVSDLMTTLGIAPWPLSAGRYARALHREILPSEPERFIDSMLVAALIEARSLERFLLLSHRLPEPAAGLYARLAESERRHFRFYLDTARGLGGTEKVQPRLDALKLREANLAISPDTELRFHSGPITE